MTERHDDFCAMLLVGAFFLRDRVTFPFSLVYSPLLLHLITPSRFFSGCFSLLPP